MLFLCCNSKAMTKYVVWTNDKDALLEELRKVGGTLLWFWSNVVVFRPLTCLLVWMSIPFLRFYHLAIHRQRNRDATESLETFPKPIKGASTLSGTFMGCFWA